MITKLARAEIGPMNSTFYAKADTSRKPAEMCVFCLKPVRMQKLRRTPSDHCGRPAVNAICHFIPDQDGCVPLWEATATDAWMM